MKSTILACTDGGRNVFLWTWSEKVMGTESSMKNRHAERRGAREKHGEREWCWRGLSGVQQGSSAGVLVLKEASSRTEIPKPVNLQHNNSGVQGLPILPTWTIPQYVCALMNYLGSYANQTMEGDTVHMLRVCVSVAVLLWECESLKVGTGQPCHPCSVFLPKSKIGRSGEVANKMLL